MFNTGNQWWLMNFIFKQTLKVTLPNWVAEWKYARVHLRLSPVENVRSDLHKCTSSHRPVMQHETELFQFEAFSCFCSTRRLNEQQRHRQLYSLWRQGHSWRPRFAHLFHLFSLCTGVLELDTIVCCLIWGLEDIEYRNVLFWVTDKGFLLCFEKEPTK